MNIAQGSVAELRTQIYISREVNIFSDLDAKERGRNKFPNYASQIQAIFARSQIPKLLK
ncbi:MAG: hypothetical protein HF982_11935 [Desulfobacteraceae bacterium]|nr:hypothetical protein [Desulfobacteraceae bacterium]MBC2720272.1 hypothetical protein [Desulfobacteraceae bacterium]